MNKKCIDQKNGLEILPRSKGSIEKGKALMIEFCDIFRYSKGKWCVRILQADVGLISHQAYSILSAETLPTGMSQSVRCPPKAAILQLPITQLLG